MAGGVRRGRGEAAAKMAAGLRRGGGGGCGRAPAVPRGGGACAGRRRWRPGAGSGRPCSTATWRRWAPSAGGCWSAAPITCTSTSWTGNAGRGGKGRPGETARRRGVTLCVRPQGTSCPTSPSGTRWSRACGAAWARSPSSVSGRGAPRGPARLQRRPDGAAAPQTCT